MRITGFEIDFEGGFRPRVATVVTASARSVGVGSFSSATVLAQRIPLTTGRLPHANAVPNRGRGSGRRGWYRNQAVPTLRLLLNDPSPRVRACATDALEQDGIAGAEPGHVRRCHQCGQSPFVYIRRSEGRRQLAPNDLPHCQ
jgi:hypothetical protein